MEFIIVAIILIFIVLYRKYKGENVSKFITEQATIIYDKFAPYSFKLVREKTKELGQEYTARQYLMQVIIFTSFGRFDQWHLCSIFSVNNLTFFIKIILNPLSF